MKKAAIRLIVSIMFTALCTKAVPGFDIKLVKKTKLSQETAIFENIWSFCVTEDKLFLIPDYKAGDVKIFASNGDLLKILGRRGFGPGEFAKPAYSFYNKEKKIFGVLDLGTRKIFLYQRTGKTGFKRVKELYCLAGASAIRLKDDRLLISGYKPGPEGKHYDFYYIDTAIGKTTFLLPSYCKYGLASPHEFKTQYMNKIDIRAIGIDAWFDIHGDEVFFSWEGDLNIIRLNIKSGKYSSFGKKTAHYIKPTASKALLEARRTRQPAIIESEWDKMSYIKNIFAGPEYVLVIYRGPVKQGGGPEFRMQFYTLDGKYLADIPIPGKPSFRMIFDKDKNILYSLVNELDDKLSEKYFVLEYKVSN